MLIIRKEQIAALAAAGEQRFQERVAEHVRRFFPERCEAIGQEASRERIQQAVDRAREHGFSSARDLCHYVDLVFACGPDFDREQAWAREVLEDEAPTARAARMDVLRSRALEWLECAPRGRGS